MKRSLFLSLAAACCLASAAPAPAPAPAAPVAAAPAAAPETPIAAPAPAAAVAAPATAGVPAASQPLAPPSASASASAGSLLQTILALCFVLALLVGLAWVLKRYGPQAGKSNAALRVVGSLSLGGRERIMVVEVGEQWIVVGAAPGRVNALATMPRREGEALAAPQHGPAAASFSEWLKQTIENRNGK